MRIISLTLLAMLLVGTMFAQPWLQHLPEGKAREDLTFFDYRKAFETYWAPYNVDNGLYVENGETKKAPGWKQFKRWEYMMEHRVDMTTGAFPTQSAFDITKAFFKDKPHIRTSTVSDWQQIGPTYSEGGSQGIGRMNCVAFHPTDLNTYWAGSASGGLWMTTDDASTWQCQTDQEESLGISDIVVSSDYEESQTIYIATGDRDFYDTHSVGVLKSTDGGQHWDTTGLSFELAERKFVLRLIQHPVDLQTLYASTSDGLFLTTDGGEHWDEQLSDLMFMDLEFHPTDPSIIYGSNFEGDIYVSQNSGDTWTRRLNDLAGKRTEIAVTPAAPDWVYAITESGGLDGIYQSTDKGQTFVKHISGDTLNMLHWNANGIGTGGQGYFDLAIAASPIDPSLLFIGGVNTWRSSTAGVSWEISNNFAGNLAQVVHADKHSLRFHPNGEIWECNDGGIYVSYDQGVTWIDKTNGIAISQMYKLGVSATDPDEIITGLQDNGSKLHTATGWQQVNGGDGMEAMIDYSDINVQYSTTQSGSLFRTLDHWETARYIKPNDAGAGAWVTPWAMDPEDPKILFGGFREIWKTTDRGNTWAAVSSINHVDKIRSIAIAPSSPNTIYAAGAYYLYKSTTGGEPFNRLTGNVPDYSLSYLSVKADDPETVWIATSGFITPGVFQSIDGGETWTDISAGLPKIPVHTVIQNRQSTEEVELFAGTELGVYYKKGDAEWIPFSTGLPNVIVMELEMYYDADPTQSKLRAATYGRGLWETRIEFNSSPMEYISSTTKQNNTTPLKPNQTDQEMLKIEIHTSGDLEPLHLNSITFNTEGCTNPSTDITSAKVYYTGSANGFLTNQLFGEVYAGPNGTFTVTGDQPLNNGVNYFWLAYDIPESATIGNFLDAQCTAMNIGTEIFPAVINPEGNRQIQLIYCPAGSTHLSQDFISHVKMGAVDQVSVKGENGYQNFTDQVIDMEFGTSIPISVTNNAPHNGNELLIWVDWNIDADFEDQGELVYASGPLGITTYNTSFAAPPFAETGITRMRIRLHDTSFGPNATPCDVANLGEVEDYAILVKETMVGTTHPGDLEKVTIHPNPAKSELQVSIVNAQAEQPLIIIDVFGRVQYAGVIHSETTIDISDYAPGLYFITFKHNQGTPFYKFIKAE